MLFTYNHALIFRHVATRVVERFYFELPSSPAPTSVRTTGLQYDRAPIPTPNSTTMMISSMPECQPQNYVVFLKTHKTGSSTITNILNRYADRKNLTMLLPKDETFYSFNWPNKFRLGYAKDNHGNMPNILANHARYSRKSLNYLFPRERTSYITILREPVKQWESTFSYMSFPYILNIYKRRDPLEFFLTHPPTIKNIKKIARRYPSIYLIKNPLFFDLGFDYKHFDNATMIRRALGTIDKDFDLVLMMEHFDESMVLLKRRLCWSIDDVVFFKTNERLNKNKRVLTSEQEESIKKWNNADIALYDYFIDKFWKEIEKEGPEFYDDLQKLRQRKRYHFRTCVEKEKVTEAYSSVYVKGYEMKKNLTTDSKLFCERMLRNELAYQDYFKSKYTKKIASLEGETIENFDDQFEEAEVDVESGSPWGKEGQTYDYGLPTKSPKPSTSKVAKKRKERDENEQRATTKSKINTTMKRKLERQAYYEKQRDGATDTMMETEDSNEMNQQTEKSTSEVEGRHKKEHIESSENEPSAITPTVPITIQRFNNDKLMTLERHMNELERTTEEAAFMESTETPVLKTEPATKHKEKTENTGSMKPNKRRLIGKNKRTNQSLTTKTGTKSFARDNLRAADKNSPYTGKAVEIESANKELRKDDPRRYDGRTIIVKKRKIRKN